MLTDDALKFIGRQGCVIVATIDDKGYPHTSCKGIVTIEDKKIYLLDVFKANTYQNLLKNKQISLTSVDEHKYVGYCLKGSAEIVTIKSIDPAIIAIWKDKITKRITSRIIKNIQGEKGHPEHPEARLPQPKYMIVFTLENVISLSPQRS